MRGRVAHHVLVVMSWRGGASTPSRLWGRRGVRGPLASLSLDGQELRIRVTWGRLYGTTNLDSTPADVSVVFPWGDGTKLFRRIGIGIELLSGAEYRFTHSDQARILDALEGAGYPVKRVPRELTWT